MLWSSTETLDLIEPHLADHLVPSGTFVRAKEIVGQLPEAFSSYYFECRLTADTPQVDFLTCATTPDKGRENFVSYNGTGSSLQGFLGNAVWDPIIGFSKKWVDPTSILSEQIPLMWLEFDQVDSPLPEIPLPSFSFCIDPKYMYRHFTSRGVNNLDSPTFRAVTEQTLGILYGGSLPSANKQALFACFDALPPGGQIIHLSSMLARQPAFVKVYGSVPKKHLIPYLDDIAWPGSGAELANILKAFCTPNTIDQNIYIDLTLGETVMPRIGIAFAQQQIENLPGQDPTRKALLDRCVKEGLCSPQKREALALWPGNFYAFFSGKTWPIRFHKWLDIKLVYQPDHPLEAKGYLGFMPQFSLF